MNLSYMDTETVSQIYARVSRQREALEQIDRSTDERAAREHLYLCEVEDALEIVGGFLNGEHAAFCEKRDRRSTDREVFNTP